MFAYAIAQVHVTEMSEYKKYMRAFMAMFNAYEGEVLAAQNEPVVLEGDWPAKRTVIIKFKNMEEAKRWYYSDEYQAAAKHRHAGAITNLVLAEGLF